MSILFLEADSRRIKALADKLQSIADEQQATTLTKRQVQDATFVLQKRTKDISETKKIR